MAKRAEMETAVGTSDSIRNVDQLNDAFNRLAKTGQSTGALLRDMHKEWTKPTALSTSIVKLGAQVIGGQIRDAASAIAEPAKTSYSQALAKATEYRDATQRIATSTGSSYVGVSEQIDATARRLGILPGRVSDYSRSVRHLTGDWQGAASGLDAYQNRALKTDRTLEELIPTAATLAQTFGLKSTDDVNRFFGTLDRQAKNAGVSAEIAEKAFMSASSSLAMITSAKPGQLSALTTTMLGGAPTPELGMARTAGIAGFIDSHDRYIEARMRKAGKLKKGEHLRDDQGLIQGDKLFDALEFVQGDLGDYYHTKDKRELVGRIGQSGMMAPQIAAGLLSVNVASLRQQARPGPMAENMLPGFLASGAGQGARAAVTKELRDIGLGSAMLPAQDAATSMGGGMAGIAIASAGSVFEKATGTFWSAVEIFAGASKKGGGAGAGAASAAETAVGTAIGNVVTGGATSAIIAAVLPIAAMAAIGYFGYKDITSQEGDYKKAREQDEEDKKQATATGMDVVTYRRMRSKGAAPGNDQPIQMAPAVPDYYRPGHAPGMVGPWRDDSGPGNKEKPADVRAQADAHAQAMEKMFSNQTLRVQIVTPPQSPPGQPLPP